MPGQYSKEATTSFQMLSNSSFICHITIRSHVVKLLAAVYKVTIKEMFIFQMVLTMVCNIQNYWIFRELLSA
jgi:hypothetical protein